jgi:RimJ/RimL family protein N-acetyltransferase
VGGYGYGDDFKTREGVVETERLILRPWNDGDAEPFARLNADPRVMEFISPPLSREASDAMIFRARAHLEQHGFGPLAAECKVTGRLIGFIGLVVPSFEAHFTPCVEIGWRLAFESWGQGLATEGAKGVLRLGFGRWGLKEVVSFTASANLRSRRVMEKLGMTQNPEEDFDHPRVAEGNPLRRHVLYRLRAS